MLRFVELAHKYNIPIDASGRGHHKSAGWVQLHCPLCTNGTFGWHLGFNPTSGAFSCWRCGKLTQKAVLQALIPGVSLAHLYAEFSSQSKGSPKFVRHMGLAESVELPADCGPLLPAHRKYLKNRGFNPSEISNLWGVQGIGKCGGEWAWRILIPLYDPTGRLVSYTARSIAEQTDVKYLNLSLELSVMNPKQLLYGLHKIHDKETIAVVEGPTDVWRIGPGAVSILGANWSIDQATQLLEFKRITLLPDNDPTGIASMYRLSEWLKSCDAEITIVEGIESDPGSMSQDQVEEFRKEFLYEINPQGRGEKHEV